MEPIDAEAAERGDHGLGGDAGVADARPVEGGAVAGQIEGDHPAAGLEPDHLADPGFVIAGEAVQKDDRRTAFGATGDVRQDHRHEGLRSRGGHLREGRDERKEGASRLPLEIGIHRWRARRQTMY